ncbi:hypothetical protein AC579_4767 [Pseudocercospora musae]|uniref:Uncharacterized protein n=1 Tax=Pseudocercospora musae TaxID=113226 RepID=A0A139IQL7_9PEZI|nr:hypothetical protein AC579_4767 [Pseudocercospora musae]
MAKIEYFRIPPRWLFSKITDSAGSNQEISLGVHYNAGGSDVTSCTKKAEAWHVQDGMTKLMTGPGLWILDRTVDEHAVRAAAVDAKAWSSPHFVGAGGENGEW